MGNEIVLIGDIIKSRKKFDPKNWKNFHKGISKINKQYADNIKIPLTVYSGDSYGAIIKDLESVIRIVLKIPEIINEYRSRIIVVEDEVSYGMRKKKFVELEGPALWKSEEMLRQLKRSGKHFKLARVGTETSQIIETMMNLILAIKYDWNSTQRSIFKVYNETTKQETIAKKFKISQQYVSKIIVSSNFKLVKEASENLIKIVNGDNTFSL